MSYMSPPESRSRVENIKKKFEATNNESSSPNLGNSGVVKTPVNKSSVACKVPSSNGFKNNVSPKKKTLQNSKSTPFEMPKKPTNLSPGTKPVNSGEGVRTERPVSSPSSRGGHIRRSPAFRCDKIVKGRNVTGQASGLRARTVLDNRVKLFEDGEGVKAVVKRLNTSPLAATLNEELSDKSATPQKVETFPDVTDATVSGNGNSSHVNSAESAFTSTPDAKTPVNNKPTNHDTKPVNSSTECTPQVPVTSFLHKYEQDRSKLPLEIKRNVINRALEKSKNTNIESYAKVNNSSKVKDVNGVKSENDCVVPTSFNSDTTLTDSLKAALKAPLPPGPPPKKPPRTFAHNILSNSSSSSSATTSAMTESPHQVKFTKSASADIASAEKTGKPVRSKTESEIKLKKLESVLLNHQHGSGGVILRPKSPMVRRTLEDKATATYDEPEAVRAKPVKRLGPLPSLPSESELLNSVRSTVSADSNARFGGCINLNCVSTNSNSPLYSQVHFYEKVPEKQSEFFVAVPKKTSHNTARPYGTLLRSRSRSEEHIYAEPFEFLNKSQNKRNNLQSQKSSPGAMKGGESIGDLSKVGALLEELQKQTSKPGIAPKTPVLHYLCTPISPESATRTTENETKCKNSESKVKEPFTPIIERRASEPHSMGSDSDEKKKPSLLRFAALMKGGQTSSTVDGTGSKIDRTKETVE